MLLKMLHRFVVLLLGPALIAAGSTPWVTVIPAKICLWVLGTLVVAYGAWRTETDISRVEAERVLNTAVDFIHAMSSYTRQEKTQTPSRVRANFARRLLLRRDHLKMRYTSFNYRKFERVNVWRPQDDSCASTALERGVVVLGGHDGELIAKSDLAHHFPIHVMKMKDLPGEGVRSVLCLPVYRCGKGDPIGVVSIDDENPLNESALKTPEILLAAKELASRGFDHG
jgi:hypothetical protein